MFVYQNKDGHICVTFTDNKPVEAPEFVFAIDEEAKAIYSVVGTVEQMPETDEVEDEVVVDAKVPTIEVLDNVVENDDVSLDIAPVTDADNFGAPSVEELDAVVENDPEVVEEEEEESTVEPTEEV